MRLHELFFEDRAVDFDVKRDEIPMFTDPKTSKPMGTFDGYEIRAERFCAGVDAYGVFDDATVKAVIFLSDKEANVIDRPVNDVIKIWVDPRSRGKGYATCLLLFLLRKLKLKLRVDSVTDDGEMLIKKLVMGKKIDLVAVRDGVAIDADLDQIFSIPNRIDVILESWQLMSDRRMFEHEKVSDLRLIRGAPDGEWE